MKKILIFGVFDGIHDGHRFLFAEARKHGNQLIVAAAPDEIVQRLKNHAPRLSLTQRIEALRAEPLVDEVQAGDTELGTYEIIKKCNPDIIALGYDQQLLKKDLEMAQKENRFDRHFEIIVMGPCQPDTMHSSLLRQ